MKQLTKEHHEAICEWLLSKADDMGHDFRDTFTARFPPSCCDSCADGDTCESEPIIISQEDYQATVKKVNEIIKRFF